MSRLRCYIILMIVATSTVVFARAKLPEDYIGRPIPDMAPNGKKALTLTVNKTHTDMSDNLRWAIYNDASGCKFRTSSTATRAGTFRTVPTSTWFQRGVNPVTPFIGYSGCSAAYVDIQ